MPAGKFRKIAGLRNGPVRSDVLHVAAAAVLDVLTGVYANLPEAERKAMLRELPGVIEKEIAAKVEARLTVMPPRGSA